jgi:hypothetical protein
MTCYDTPTDIAEQPSLSRMRHVESRLRSDAEALLREMAYVLKLTQQVRDEMSAAGTGAAACEPGD